MNRIFQYMWLFLESRRGDDEINLEYDSSKHKWRCLEDEYLSTSRLFTIEFFVWKSINVRIFSTNMTITSITHFALRHFVENVIWLTSISALFYSVYTLCLTLRQFPQTFLTNPSKLRIYLRKIPTVITETLIV
jgi:hypothetical protein